MPLNNKTLALGMLLALAGCTTPADVTKPIDAGKGNAVPGRGLFAAKNVIDLQRMPIHSGVQRVKLVTTAKPSFAGADPYNILIDRNSNDNVIATVG